MDTTENTTPEAVEPVSTDASTTSTNTQTDSGSSFLDRIDEQLKFVEFEDRPAQTSDTGSTEEVAEPDVSSTVSHTPIEEVDEQTLDLDTKAKAKWGELRKELKEAKSRLAELEQSPVDENETQADQDYYQNQLAVYQDLINQYEQQMSVIKVEASPIYHESVTQPMEAIISASEKIAETYGVNPEQLIDAITEADPKRQTELLADLVDIIPERDRQRVYRMADDCLMIFERDAQIRANAEHAAKELDYLERQQFEQKHQQYRQQLTQATEQTWEILSERLSSYIPDVDVESLRQDSMEADLDSATPELKSYSASAGILLPHLVKSLASKTAEIEELKKTLRGYQKSAPKVASNAPPASQRVEAEGFLEAISKRLGR